MPYYPSHYQYGMQPIPQQYQMGYGNPQSLSTILAWLLANQPAQEQPQSSPEGWNSYVGSLGLNPPVPTGLSPLGRFNDMVLRQSANIANRTADAKSAVAETSERQRLVDSITHPPPAAPYSISPVMSPTGAPNAILNSRYGTGSVSFAPPGTSIHGTFGPDHLPFGEIGGINAGRAMGADPNATTYQQEMVMDSINKALGRKRKPA